VLPDDVLTQVDRAYRDELDPPDNTTYTRLMATGCATWAIIRASRLRLIASEDQAPAEALRRRTQIVQTLTSAATTATPVYPNLTRWFTQLTGTMQLRWSESRQPPQHFPAYTARRWRPGVRPRGPGRRAAGRPAW
jgi:hypothetical protein